MPWIERTWENQCEPVKCLARSMAKSTPGGSQEGCTLLVGDQTLGSSFGATNVSEVHFNLR